MTALASSTVGTSIDGIQASDGGKGFALGNTVLGANGKKYVLVQASGDIAALAAGREVTITEPAMTAATGTGGFRAPLNLAVATGEQFWAMEKTLGNGT
tara:strand:- start:357 stop:653 length:297 start_codon:yes stop_codon:yes gene_type:complete